MLRWDRHAEVWIVAHRTAALDPVFRWLTYLGTDGALWLALAAGLTLVTRRRGPLLWVAVADAAAQLVTRALQALLGRARPHVDRIVSEPHSHSFPSGHTSSSVACALVLASFAPRLRAGLIVLAAAIAYSRLYVGVHYPLDVLGGAVLGALLAWATLRGCAARQGQGRLGEAMEPRGLRRLGAGRRRSRSGPREG